MSYTAQAVEDLVRIWSVVRADNGEETADRIIDELMAAAERLSSFLGIGRRPPGIRSPDVLGVTHRRWWIFYVVAEGGASVIRVVDGAQDFTQLDL